MRNFLWLVLSSVSALSWSAEEKPFCGLQSAHWCLRPEPGAVGMLLVLPSQTADGKPSYAYDLKATLIELRALIDDVYGKTVPLHQRSEELNAKLKEAPQDPVLRAQLQEVHLEQQKALWSPRAVRTRVPYAVSAPGKNQVPYSQSLQEHKKLLDQALKFLEDAGPKPELHPNDEANLVRELGSAILLVGALPPGQPARIFEVRGLDRYEACSQVGTLNELPPTSYERGLSGVFLMCYTKRTSSSEKQDRDYYFVNLNATSFEPLFLGAHQGGQGKTFRTSPYYSSLVWVSEDRTHRLLDLRDGKPEEISLPRIPVKEVLFLPEGQVLFGNEDILYAYIPNTTEVKEIFRRTQDGHEYSVSPQRLLKTEMGWVYRNGNTELYRVNLVGGNAQRLAQGLTKDDRILYFGGFAYFHSHTLVTNPKGPYTWVDSFRALDSEGRPTERRVTFNDKQLAFSELPQELRSVIGSAGAPHTGIAIRGRGPKYAENMRLYCLERPKAEGAKESSGSSCWMLGKVYGTLEVMAGPELAPGEVLVSAAFAENGEKLLYITQKSHDYRDEKKSALIYDTKAHVKKAIELDAAYLDFIPVERSGHQNFCFLLGDGQAYYRIYSNATRGLFFASSLLPPPGRYNGLSLTADGKFGVSVGHRNSFEISIPTTVLGLNLLQ